MKKSPQKSMFSTKWLFWWLYLQFWFLNFCLRWAITIIAYCFNHLFFLFSPVCVHPGKQSLSKGCKSTWKTINWHRNCPRGCQYARSQDPGFGGWLCLIFLLCFAIIISVGICLVNCLGQASNQIKAWSGSDLPFISLWAQP